MVTYRTRPAQGALHVQFHPRATPGIAMLKDPNDCRPLQRILWDRTGKSTLVRLGGDELRGPRRRFVGMTVFVLVHGNFHDGSAWNGVSRCLEQLGHVAHAPTLPGHGRDVPTNVGYRDAAESVAGYVVQRDLRDIVLVGHSGGGVAISNTVSDRVQRLVYLSGWVLQDGESILEMLPAHYPWTTLSDWSDKRDGLGASVRFDTVSPFAVRP